MKRSILALLLAVLILGGLTTAFAADAASGNVVFDVRSLVNGYTLTVDQNTSVFRLTTPAFTSGELVYVALVSGEGQPSAANTKYTDQKKSSGTALTFELMPSSPLAVGQYSVYVSTSSMDLTKVAAFQYGEKKPYVIGTNGYATFDKAREAANEGDIIKMQINDTYSGVLYVPAGVTLDLNAHTLTTTQPVLVMGKLIDSCDGTGLLKAAKTTNNVILPPDDNGYTSIYDSDAKGYRLFKVSMFSQLSNKTDKDAIVWCKPVFTNSYAYTLLAKAGHGCELVVSVNWGAGEYRFKFSQTLLTQLCNELETQPRTALWVKFVGLNNVNSVSAETGEPTAMLAVPTLKADTNISTSGNALELK